jgi:hypothetical protein
VLSANRFDSAGPLIFPITFIVTCAWGTRAGPSEKKTCRNFPTNFHNLSLKLAKKHKHKTAYNNMSLIKICFVLLCCNFLYTDVVVAGWLTVKSQVQAAAGDIVCLCQTQHRQTNRRTVRCEKKVGWRLAPNILESRTEVVLVVSSAREMMRNKFAK